MSKQSIDYEELYRDRDRSWSLRIDDRLKERIDKKELKAILNFVDTYDDFRIEAPVTQILEDSSLSEWNASDALLRLVSDPVHVVRRYACYVAKDLSPNEMLKEALYKIFHHADTTDSFASETLESYIIHAEGQELNQWLLQALMTDGRESIRQSLVWTLATRNSALLSEALPLLYTEPLLTWEVHAALLDRCISYALPTADLAPLMAIDDFEVQKNLARLAAGSTQLDA